MTTDVAVIGGGVVGTAIAMELTRFRLKVALLEREPDLAMGATKANSGVIHAGFDAPTGSMKAKMNVAGNKRYHDIKDELDLDIQWTGSWVAAFTDEDMAVLHQLKERGLANGVRGLEIVKGSKVREIEPNLNPELKAALWAPTAGVCWPFGMARAFMENAVVNGAELLRDADVIAIDRTAEGFAIHTADARAVNAKIVVNAAGLFADKVSALAGDASFSIKPRKGEYILFDQTAQPSLVNGVVFPTPSANSKGILVCATTHGNVFIGPNANNVDGRDDVAVSQPGMDEIIAGAQRLVPSLPLGASITQFAGLRAVSSTGDFILGESETVPGLWQAAGIQSPGLTSAPAIGVLLAKQIAERLDAPKNAAYRQGCPPHPVLRRLPADEKAALIAKDPRYGRVVCRCETITEGEIVDAITRPCGARTVDGIKRRVRAGMGRCQGGFCGPRVVEILARELHCPVPDILKDTHGSQLYFDKHD